MNAEFDAAAIFADFVAKLETDKGVLPSAIYDRHKLHMKELEQGNLNALNTVLALPQHSCDAFSHFGGRELKTEYSGYGHSFALRCKVLQGNKIEVLHAEVDGQNVTSQARSKGLLQIQPNKSNGYDCQNCNYYLAWEIVGEAAQFITRYIEAPLLYWNYNQDNKMFFYFFKVTWHWAEVHYA